MDERHLQYPTEGVLQLQDYFRDEGLKVNHKRIRRLRRKMGIRTQYPRRLLTKLGKAEYIRPYLLRNLKIERPNQAWAVDITYIPMKKGFMYLAAIIDLHSRFVVAWSLSNSMTSEWVCLLVKEAVRRHGAPEIINSDQGSQFTCREWISLLQGTGIRVSMDGKGRAIDNVFIGATCKVGNITVSPSMIEGSETCLSADSSLLRHALLATVLCEARMTTYRTAYRWSA